MMNEKEDYKIHANKDTSLSLSLSLIQSVEGHSKTHVDTNSRHQKDG